MGIIFVYFMGFYFGAQKATQSLEAQYAEEDKESEKTVANLVKDLKDQCEEDKEFILNNIHGK